MCPSNSCDCDSNQHTSSATTIFRHFYADDATPEGLAARTLEFTRSSTVIKLTPDPYFMTLSFGGRAAPREHNDVRPALVAPPVSPTFGGWEGFKIQDRTHIECVLSTVRLLKASPEAKHKQLYVNVFAPFTVAMQCDPRLVERLSDTEERPAVARGLSAIAAATSEYILALSAAGADGIFYANKSMRSELGELVEEWVVPLDMAALAPVRPDMGAAGQDEEEGGAGRAHAPVMDVVLHCCGSHIDYARILSALGDRGVYPENTALSWNFEEGNPSLEHVLETTDLRVWGTYPRALLRKAADDERYLAEHRAWLEQGRYMHRVVVGPDCCPGAFIGEEMPAAAWDAVHRAYRQWVPHAQRPAAGLIGGA